MNPPRAAGRDLRAEKAEVFRFERVVVGELGRPFQGVRLSREGRIVHLHVVGAANHTDVRGNFIPGLQHT